jgi:hypothetical protein
MNANALRGLTPSFRHILECFKHPRSCAAPTQYALQHEVDLSAATAQQWKHAAYCTSWKSRAGVPMYVLALQTQG